MDRKIEVLNGRTVGQSDAAKLESARASIKSYVRTSKGLPELPIELDAEILRHLSPVPVIEGSEKITTDQISGSVVHTTDYKLKPSGYASGLVSHRESDKKKAA